MEHTIDQNESLLMENQFQQIISEIKASFPVWDEFLLRTGKLQTAIKSLVVMLASFLETFHKLTDIASGTRGGYVNEMGVGLAKLGIRQKGIEDKVRSLTNAFSESLIIPTQDKLEEWRKAVVCIDKDHKSEFKRAQQDAKKASSEALKLKKKIKKGCKPEIQKQLENAVSDHQVKVHHLEQLRRSFMRSAVGFSRSQYCHLITCFRPLVDIQLSMMTDLSSIQDTMDVLIMQSLSIPPNPPTHVTNPPNHGANPPIHVTNPNTPPSPDTSKGSYQDLFPGKPPTQVNPEESRKSSLSSSSSIQNNVSNATSLQHLSNEKEIFSKDLQEQQSYRHHHHHHSCTSYESIKHQQHQCNNHNHHHHCHHRSTPPVISSPSSSSSSPPPPPLLPNSSSLPSSPTRPMSAKSSMVTFPSPPPECTCGGVTVSSTNKISQSPYALPLYIGEDSHPVELNSPGEGVVAPKKHDYTKLFATEGGVSNSETTSVKHVAMDGDHMATRSQTVLTLEGYVKMNQLASYYVQQQRQQGDSNNHQLSVKKDLPSLNTLKFLKELSSIKSSTTAGEVLDCLKKAGVKGQTQPILRRSNLRDRSLPPNNRKNMRVQFVPQSSSSSPSSSSSSSMTRKMANSPTSHQKHLTKTMSMGKSHFINRTTDSNSPSCLPPLPPLELLKQEDCLEELDDLPLPPPPEELTN